MSQHVLLVDDDPDVIRLLRRGFQEDGFAITVAGTGRDALAAIRAAAPDLVVLDVGLPDIRGTEVARQLRQGGMAAPILMLTALDGERHVVEGLDSGATAYVTKPVRMSEIRAWARALLRGGASARPGTPRTMGPLQLDPERGRLHLATNGATVRLTPIQVRLTAVLMEAAGKPVSREDLLRRVWDVTFEPGTTLVEVHVLNLRRRLAGLGGHARLETVRGAGYRLKVNER